VHVKHGKILINYQNSGFNMIEFEDKLISRVDSTMFKEKITNKLWWQIDIKNETAKKTKHVEFLRNNAFLFSFLDQNDSSTSVHRYRWSLYFKDSFTLLLMDGVTYFLTNFNRDCIDGWASHNGSLVEVQFKETNFCRKKIPNGEWINTSKAKPMSSVDVLSKIVFSPDSIGVSFDFKRYVKCYPSYYSCLGKAAVFFALNDEAYFFTYNQISKDQLSVNYYGEKIIFSRRK
jgi:hypothetical protein